MPSPPISLLNGLTLVGGGTVLREAKILEIFLERLREIRLSIIYPGKVRGISKGFCRWGARCGELQGLGTDIQFVAI